MTYPTAAQCRDLVALGEGTVANHELDLNGHMNAAYFFIAHVTSARAALASVGVSEEYVAERKMGTFAAEQYVRYLDELREGDRYSVRPRFVGRTEKAIHLMSFLVNESKDSLASVLEVISLHVDQVTRRTTAMPEDLARRVDERLQDGRELSWELPPVLTLRTGS